MAATSCFNGTFSARPESQLDDLRKLIDQVDDNVFLAKLAEYSRERAFMKDMPAALLLSLSQRDTELMHCVSIALSTTVAFCARCSRWCGPASSDASACHRRCSERSSAG